LDPSIDRANGRTGKWVEDEDFSVLDLKSGELHLVSQAEEIRETKKQRLEEPFPASTHEAATSICLQHTAVSLPAAATDAADVDGDHADADLVKDTRATGHWTPEEDAKLSSAVTNTREKKLGKAYITDWDAIAVLVPGRTRIQCWSRWHDALNPSISQASGRKSRWTVVEDSKLKDAVQMHGGKNWVAISALIPGRTNIQCY
jgi:hypothetical protein